MLENRLLSSGSSFSDSDGNNSLDQSHIQQIFQLKNQFLNANTTMELQNTSAIKSGRQSVKSYQDQLTLLSEQIKQLKLQHESEIERVLLQKETQMKEMEVQFQSLLLRERQSIDQSGSQDELKRAIERCNKVTDEQLHKTEVVKMKLTERNHEYNILKESFDREQRNNVVLKEELLQLKIENRQSENQINLLKSELQSKMQGYTQYEDVLNDSLKRAKEKLHQVDADYAQLQTKFNQMQIEMNQHENQKQGITHKQQVLENENLQLRHKLSDYSNENYGLQQQIKELNEQYLERERQWREQEIQSEDYRLSTNGLHNRIQSMELLIIEQKKEINSLQNDKLELSHNLKQLRDTVFGSIRTEFPTTQADLSGELRQLEQYVANLRDEKHHYEEMLTECKQMVISLEQELSHSHNQREDLQRTIRQLKVDHDKELQDLRMYAQQGQIQQQTINQMKLQLQECQFKLDTHTDNYEQRLREKDLMIQQLQVQLQIFDKDYRTMTLRVEEENKIKFEERLSKVQMSVQEKAEQLHKEYTQRIKLLEEEQSRLKEQHERTVEHLQHQYQTRQTESINSQVQQWRRKEQELMTSIQERDLQIDIERKQLKILQDQLSGYENLEQRESIRIKDRQQLLGRDLFEANKQKAQLICQVSKLQTELDHCIANMQKPASDDIYKRENEKLHQMIDRLTDQLMLAEDIAQSEQRNSIQSKSQLEMALRERDQIRQQSTQLNSDSIHQLQSQLQSIQIQLKQMHLLNEEVLEDKNKIQRLYNELQDDHDQLYQQYKDKESEAFELNKLYVELLSGQTDRQTNSARSVQQLQFQLEQNKQELALKEQSITRYREQVIELQKQLSEQRTIRQLSPINLKGDDLLSPGFHHQSYDQQERKTSQFTEKQPQGQGANRIVILQAYTQQQMEQIRLRLKDLKAKIVEKLTIYQELIKRKQRSQTKQSIHGDLLSFREDLIKVFEGLNLSPQQKEEIYYGAMVQIKYSDIRVQDDINQQIVSFATFIESFNQLVAKASDKSVEQSQIGKKQIAKHKLAKSFVTLKAMLQQFMKQTDLAILQQHFQSLAANESDESALKSIVNMVEITTLGKPDTAPLIEQLSKFKKLVEYLKRHP